MDYTEVPTDVLAEVVDLVSWINDDGHVTDSGDVVVEFSADALVHMEPLSKWLEYIQSTWAANVRLEDSMQL